MSEAARSIDRLKTPAIPWSVGARAAGLAASGLYLALNVVLPPNHADGGLLLDYIRLMADGQRPYWDFIDAYGPLNWVLPVLAYRVAGEQMWAVAAATTAVKWLSVLLGFRLVDRLAGPVPAWLAAGWLTVLLGAPWQLLQTPYAMHPALSLELGVWLLLLAPPRVHGHLPGPSGARLVLAGVLTGVLLWTKINSGAFLLAGGLFYCFYWLPAGGSAGPGPQVRAPRWLQVGWVLGLVAYACVFVFFVRSDLASLFFPYLVVPLLLVVVATARELWIARPPRWLALERLRAWALFFAGAGGFALAFGMLYFGPRGAVGYVRELGLILGGLAYHAPFPALGQPGQYVGFNELYWPQLPWLVTLGFVLVYGAAERGRVSSRCPRAVWAGLFALFTFQAFVIYARADEAHLVQAVWPAAPAAIVLLATLWDALGRPVLLGRGLAAAAVTVALPLAVPPFPQSLRVAPGDWNSPHLAGLGFHPEQSLFVREFSPSISNHRWDVMANDAARHIDRATADGATILVTLRNELLHLNSGASAYGGRHRFLFYLLNQELITPSTFLELLPDEIERALLEGPPDLIVTAYGARPPLFVALPELERIVEERYEITGAYAHILIRERKERPAPAS